MSRFNGRASRYVDEFVEEPARIRDGISDGDDGENQWAKDDITDLLQSLLIDEADCGCKATINFKQKIIEVDLNPDCQDILDLHKVDSDVVQDAVDKLREGKHLISCVPGDGYCRCAVEIVEGVLAQ